jgi:CDGSH-type Zn-finger protein
MVPEESDRNEPQKPLITVMRDGPYIVSGVKNLCDSKGAAIEARPTMALCRCGQSSNKPFCDGTHRKVGFVGDKEEGRKPDRRDTYEGEEITIHDNRCVCAHRGHCTDRLPEVFRQGQKPWIDPDAADPDRIAEVIRACPSGALSYTRNRELHREWGGEPTILVGHNQSYHVSGHVELIDSDGNRPETGDHYCLCRCGRSKNKPFCDGTHWYVNFEDEKN